MPTAGARSREDWHVAANHQRESGRYADSRDSFEQAFALAERELSATDPAWVALLNNRAVLAKYAGEFGLAESLYRRALGIAKASSAFGPAELARLHHNLGGLAHARGDFAAGEPLAREAAMLSCMARGPDHPQSLADEVAWAGLLDGLGRHAESEPIYLRALSAWTALGEDGEVAVCCNNLGALCAAQGRWPEAEAHYRRALEIKREKLGPRHPDLGLTLHNLGVLLKQRQRYFDARVCLEDAMTIFEAGLAPDHPHRVSCSRHLQRLRVATAD